MNVSPDRCLKTKTLNIQDGVDVTFMEQQVWRDVM